MSNNEEQRLEIELAALHQEYAEKAKPLIAKLTRLYATRPMLPLSIDMETLSQEAKERLLRYMELDK